MSLNYFFKILHHKFLINRSKNVSEKDSSFWFDLLAEYWSYMKMLLKRSMLVSFLVDYDSNCFLFNFGLIMVKVRWIIVPTARCWELIYKWQRCITIEKSEKLKNKWNQHCFIRKMLCCLLDFISVITHDHSYYLGPTSKRNAKSLLISLEQYL